MLAIIGPSVVILILAKAPESPRFLVQKGRLQEALTMLAKYHANGDPDDKLVQWEFYEIQQALEDEALNNKTSYVSTISLLLVLSFFADSHGRH